MIRRELVFLSFFSLTAHEKSKKHLKNVKSLVGGSDDEHVVSVDVSPEQPGLVGFRAQLRQSHILYLLEIPVLSLSAAAEKKDAIHIPEPPEDPAQKFVFVFHAQS